jgi:hypothetical protein
MVSKKYIGIQLYPLSLEGKVCHALIDSFTMRISP